MQAHTEMQKTARSHSSQMSQTPLLFQTPMRMSCSRGAGKTPRGALRGEQLPLAGDFWEERGTR